MTNKIIRKLRHVFLNEKAVQKTYDGWKRKNYRHHPSVSFVIQSHNRSENVIHIVEKLRQQPDSEIIVIDDGSVLKHLNRLGKHLNRANEFLLRCNDLYEVITYDRALNLANGNYVALLQDDDDFDDLTWVGEAIQCFEQDPLLAILGGRDGANLLPFNADNTGLRGEFVIESKVAYRTNSFKLQMVADGLSSAGLTYVQYVDRAPMWFRRTQFQTVLKSIDINFAPFQWDDAEVCMRAWISGLHVGHYSARFKLGKLGTGGMQIWNNELHHRQDEVNIRRVYEIYGSKLPYINALVEQCNQTC